LILPYLTKYLVQRATTMKRKIKILTTALEIFRELQFEHMYNITLWHIYQSKIDYIQEQLAEIHQLINEG
jgi:hypothetical protein